MKPTRASGTSCNSPGNIASPARRTGTSTTSAPIRRALRGAQRGRHLHRPLRQRRQRLGAQHEADTLGQHSELVGRSGDVAQLREAIVRDGVGDEVEHGKSILYGESGDVVSW